MNKLERLLRGDEATYKGNKVIETKDFSAIDKSKLPICIFCAGNEEVLIHWLGNDLNKPLWNHIEFTEPSKPRTIEYGLKLNDIIVDEDGDERKVLGTLHSVIFLSFTEGFDELGGSYTLKELIEVGYKLKQPKPTKKDIEISKQEIAELKNIDINEIGEVTIKS